MRDTCVGPFRLRRKLGSGGMGEVWEAAPLEGGPAVALKWNSPGASIARFMEEVRLSRSLNHPNVIRALDSGMDGGRPWIALELLDGATLAHLRKQHEGPWPPGLVVAIGVQALAALSAVHGETGTPPIIHRDIKPSNLFLCRDGTLRLIDFGIALSADEERTKTKSGNIVASVRYSSPEQARGEQVDHRTDLFSLGLVLMELLAGRRVFDQPDDVGVISALLFQPPPRPGALASSLPPALEEALASALRSSPEARPSSASALGEALSRSLEGPPWTRADVAAWATPLIDQTQAELSASETGSSETPGLASTSTRPERPSRIPPGRSQRSLWLRRVTLATLAIAAVGGAAIVTHERAAVGEHTAGEALTAPPPEAASAPPATLVPDVAPERMPPSAAQAAVEPTPVPVAPSGPEKPRPVAERRHPARIKSAPPAGATATGWLTVGVNKGWATVTVDGKPAGETPLFRLKLAAGKHTLKAVAHDGKTWTRHIRVHANREAKVIFER